MRTQANIVITTTVTQVLGALGPPVFGPYDCQGDWIPLYPAVVPAPAVQLDGHFCAVHAVADS